MRKTLLQICFACLSLNLSFAFQFTFFVFWYKLTYCYRPPCKRIRSIVLSAKPLRKPYAVNAYCSEFRRHVKKYAIQHGRPQGRITGIFPSMKIGTNNQKFVESLKAAAQLRIIQLILAMTVYLPIWHSHCTLARFSVLVSCSNGGAVHSCPLLCVVRKVAKLANGSTVGLYCVAITWQQIFKGSLQVTTVGVCSVWLLNAGILSGNAARQGRNQLIFSGGCRMIATCCFT